MAFVCERITEEDKEYFNSIGFTALDGSPKESRWWAIDRDRNIILTSRGGVIGEPWLGYQIYINGLFVNIIADWWTEGSRFENNLKIKWVIQKMEIPQGQDRSVDEVKKIKEIVEEAFMCWAMPGAKASQIIEVKVEFRTDEKTKFISEEIIMEEDKKYYYSFNPSNILGEPMDAYWWAIDKKRGNFIYMRGNGSPAWNCISSFGLFIDGEQIFIEAEEDMKGRLNQNNIEITWTIQKIAIPKQLLYVGYEIDSIKKLIKEALEGLGHVGCERSEIKKVQVILDVDPDII